MLTNWSQLDRSHEIKGQEREDRDERLCSLFILPCGSLTAQRLLAALRWTPCLLVSIGSEGREVSTVQLLLQEATLPGASVLQSNTITYSSPTV